MLFVLSILFVIFTNIDKSSSFSVVSYLPEWRFEGCNWATLCQLSTHVILFSLEPGPSGHIQSLDRIPRNILQFSLLSTLY